MPIDKMFTDAMFGTYRNMVEDCKQKNVTGEDFDKMCAILARMEELGQQHSDMGAFNGQLVQENLFGLFGDHYGKALSAQSKQQLQEGGEAAFNDTYLLKQNLDALRMVIKSNRDNYKRMIEEADGKHAQGLHDKTFAYAMRTMDKKTIETGGGEAMLKKEAQKEFDKTLKEKPNAYDGTVEVEVLNDPEPVIKPIQDLIDLGEQEGMTYPRFLRLQIELGLDKLAEGAGVARQTYLGELELEKVLRNSPYYLRKYEKQVARFDEMAAAAKFGVPVSRELQWAMDDIRREFDPDIIKWDTIKRGWETLLDDLEYWSLSYCSFAPRIEPWGLAPDPVAATIRTQNMYNGIFPERLRLFEKYFGLSFMDIFKHPTFEWEVANNHIYYSQVFTEFMIEKIYPHCKPLIHLPKEIIKEREPFYGYNHGPKLEYNPRITDRAERYRAYYEKKFGAGRYDSKYGKIVQGDSAAAPWSWETFKFKS